MIFIPSVEDWLGDGEVIFLDDIVTEQRRFKLFFKKSLTGQMNSSDLSPIKKFYWKFFKMVLEKAQSTKNDLLTAILEVWSNFDKEYCFKLAKSMPEIIKVIIRAWEEVIKF